MRLLQHPADFSTNGSAESCFGWKVSGKTRCQTPTLLLRMSARVTEWVEAGQKSTTTCHQCLPSAWEKEEMETVKHILVSWFSATMHCLPFSLGCKVSVLQWLSQQMYSSYTYNDDYCTNWQLCKWHWSSWQADCVLILHISIIFSPNYSLSDIFSPTAFKLVFQLLRLHFCHKYNHTAFGGSVQMWLIYI